MSISMYEPRVMRAALEQLKLPRMFLRDLFFASVDRSLTEKVDVDIMSGVRRLAPFVNPKGPGKFVERVGFTTSTYTAPLVAPKTSITIEDIQTRTPGEHVYSERDPNARQAEILRRDLQSLDADISRREEWMCARALFDSAIDVAGDDVDYSITFPRDASVTLGTLGSSDRWDNAAADILAQIRAWRRAVVKVTGINPTDMVCGSDAIDAFYQSTKLKALLNIWNMNIGMVQPEDRGQGAQFHGTLGGTGIRIWSYDEWYVDPTDGVEKPMVPVKSILLGSSMARTAMRYGAVGVKTGEGATATIGLVSDSRVPQSWVEEEPPVRWLKMSARPLPVPIQNDAFLTATVLV